MIYQEHFGKRFYLDKKTGYWISTCCPKIRAHRWVWITIHGTIPKGYHIHHKNEDKSDNSIENLELIHSFRHLSLHANKPENKERMRQVADKYRDLTKPWHASEEGKTWHKLHALKCNFGNWEPSKRICLQCGKEYLTKKIDKDGSKFCHGNCKSAWRRKQGLDDILKKCVICHLEFKSNKYEKKICCSKSCAAKYRWNLKEMKLENDFENEKYFSLKDLKEVIENKIGFWSELAIEEAKKALEKRTKIYSGLKSM